MFMLLSLLDNFQNCRIRSDDSWLAGDLGSSFSRQAINMAAFKMLLVDIKRSSGTPFVIRPSRALANSSRETLTDIVLCSLFFIVIFLLQYKPGNQVGSFVESSLSLSVHQEIVKRKGCTPGMQL